MIVMPMIRMTIMTIRMTIINRRAMARIIIMMWIVITKMRRRKRRKKRGG